jgi:hypothetical protein
MRLIAVEEQDMVVDISRFPGVTLTRFHLLRKTYVEYLVNTRLSFGNLDAAF